MCGICGQYIFDREKKAAEPLLRAMLEVMDSRGPDHRGLFIGKNAGLAACVLKIRDPEHSRQPFYNENRTVVAVFNGEIYNYRELLNALRDKGHRIETSCDAEIITHLYEEHGAGFISRLNGMFSVAVFDIGKDVLFLGRDRMGIKPLYYSLDDVGITFASNLKAVLKDKPADAHLDLTAVSHYFSFNYFPGEFTPFKNIKKLLPGHCLVIENHKCRIDEYWRFRYIQEKEKKQDEYIEEFTGIFKQVIRDQLSCDVPLGAFLSGGLDSSGLYSFSRDMYPGMKTFSVGFSEKTFDEQDYLRFFDQDMRKNCYRCRLPESIGKLFDMAADSLDMPAGEGSYLPLYFLSGYAKQHVTVAFSGEGADELFGGYEMYTADILAKYCGLIPAGVRNPALAAMKKLLPLDYRWMNRRFALELFYKGVEDPGKVPHYFWREIFSQKDKKELLSTKQASTAGADSYAFFEKLYAESDSKHYLEKAMCFDSRVCLADGMLQRVDMAAMSNSLEVRVPYLDNRIVDFACRLPLNMKIRNGKGKFILKQAFKNRVPKKILDRRKHGMSAPVSKWIRYDMQEYIRDKFNGLGDDAIINKQYVLDIFEKHCSGKTDAGRKLWNLLVFCVWRDKLR